MSDRGTWKMTIGGAAFADYTDVLKADPVNGGPAIEEKNLYDAANQGFFNRGNKNFHRKYTLTKEHADNVASAQWFMVAALAFSGVADVQIFHKAYSGAETSWTISGANVEITVEEPLGVSTTTHITISGGVAV